MNVVTISDYLQGRRFNSRVLARAGEALTPAIVKFNENNERGIKCEWSMSAKYQTGTLFIEMQDDEDMSPEAEALIENQLADILDDHFGYQFDHDEIRSSYASLDVNF